MNLTSFAFVKMMNHLLVQEKWAQDLLERYVHKMVHVVMGRLSMYWQIETPGLLKMLEAHSDQADVEILIQQGAIQAYIEGGKNQAIRFVKISGDIEFAKALSVLFERLNWDVEEDLAKMIGDSAAHQIILFSNRAFKQIAYMGNGLKDAASSYLLDEQPTLVRRVVLEGIEQSIDEARDRVAVLEKRIQRLEHNDRLV